MDELGAELVGGAFAEDRATRVAGHQPGQREHDEHDPQQDGDGDEDAADDELRQRRVIQTGAMRC